MIQFKKLIMHNFGSYSHAELDLQNRGFCLVSGQNNYIKDNAMSNGSGKSFLWNALCFALTGETTNGIKTNLKNINIEEPNCYVQVDFMVNKDFYTILRVVAPKSDLKITKNDVDVSGKGIRESEKKLHELLPDITKDLIASTIIIGQGMPNKFSSFSPSGRKELLEKLTKSDFMIEDMKARIQARQQELTAKLREYEDSMLANKTQLNMCLNSLNTLKASIDNQVRPDFDKLIEEQANLIDSLQTQLSEHNTSLLNLDFYNTKLFKVSEEKSKVSAEELAAYTTSYNKLISTRVEIDLNISSLQKEITRLKAIKDICPTCGQALPNVHKPDTKEQEQQLLTFKEAKDKIENDLAKCYAQHNEYLAQIDKAFSTEILELTEKLNNLKTEVNKKRLDYNNVFSMLEQSKAKHTKLISDMQNWDSFVAKQQTEKTSLEAEVARITNLIALTSLSKEDYDNRLVVVKKMESLTRRDFRGYLLTNIISYIDSKAKDYCNTVFGTKDLTINLNGNALDITYCGKVFDGLSGGEKQRVDLIIQLAIRDLLISYLDLSSNILVLDEITDFLDKKSCQAVMKLLEKELQTIESVFIVSHHAEELEIPVDSEIKVVKNVCGISELL